MKSNLKHDDSYRKEMEILFISGWKKLNVSYSIYSQADRFISSQQQY